MGLRSSEWSSRDHSKVGFGLRKDPSDFFNKDPSDFQVRRGSPSRVQQGRIMVDSEETRVQVKGRGSFLYEKHKKT